MMRLGLGIESAQPIGATPWPCGTSPSFLNPSGQVIVPFGKPSVAHAVVTTFDALVAAGSAGDDFAVVKLPATGDLTDESLVRTSFGAPAVAYGVATMSGPKTLAVGTVRAGAGSSVAMVRYGSDTRALDPSFGTAGKLVADMTSGLDSANAVVVTAFSVGERIVVAGQAVPDVLLARYLPDGLARPQLRHRGTGRAQRDGG